MVRFESVVPPFKGTPYQMDTSHCGSVKQLRETEAEKRRRLAQESKAGRAVQAAAAAPVVPAAPAAPAAAPAPKAAEKPAPKAKAKLERQPTLKLPDDEAPPGEVHASINVTITLRPADPPAPQVMERIMILRQASKESLRAASERESSEGAPEKEVVVEDENLGKPWQGIIVKIEYPDDPPENAATAGKQEAVSAAAQVRKLARNMRVKVWNDFKNEFEVQCTIWDSVLLMFAARNGGKEIAAKDRPAADIRMEAETLFAMSTTNPSIAARKLGTLLDKDAKGEQKMSKSVQEIGAKVVTVSGLAQKRDELFKRLEEAAKIAPALPVKNETFDKDMEVLLIACALDEDIKLEFMARRALGLSMSVGSQLLHNRKVTEHEVKGEDFDSCDGSVPSHSTDPWA